MSRKLFLGESDIIKEVIYREDECRYKTNNICFNNSNFKMLGKKCHGCQQFTKEDSKIEPFIR